MVPQELYSQVKAWVGVKGMTSVVAVLSATLFSVTCSFLFLTPLTAQAQSDLEIEAENVIADSEAARAEEDEARLRAKEEKMRADEAKKTAVREMEKAKRVEVEARTRVRKLEGDEKNSKAEREVAEKKTAEAQKRQAVANEKIRVAQEKLDATRAETEKAVAIRDENDREAEKLNNHSRKLELAVDGAKTKLARTLSEVNNSKGKIVDGQEKLKSTRIGGQEDLTDIRAKILASRKELRALDASLVKLQKHLKADKGLDEVAPLSDAGAASDRSSASSPGSAPAVKPSGQNPDGATNSELKTDDESVPAQPSQRTAPARSIASLPPTAGGSNEQAETVLREGWIKVRKECDVRVAMSNSSGELGERRHIGERLFAKKIDENWMKVKLADGSQGFMTSSCFQ